MKRYRHNRSNTRVQSMNMGLLVPTMARHCVAGTTLVGGVSAGLQLAPMVHQALTQIQVKTYAISGVDRILWEDAEEFYTGGEDGHSRPIVPYIVAPADTGWQPGSLADYLGFATGVPGLKCNALPFRLYALWWNERIRREGIQDPLPVSFASGEDKITNTELQRINWPKDMFTTATLEQVLGDEAVIPIGDSASLEPDNARVYGSTEARMLVVQREIPVRVEFDIPVQIEGDPEADKFVDFTIGTGQHGCGTWYQFALFTHSGSAQYMIDYALNLHIRYNINGANPWQYDGFKSNVVNITGDAYINEPSLVTRLSDVKVDLSNATGILPSDFNFAMAQNKWKSRRNLYGTKFRDLLAFWGIRYSDRRLQLPETLKSGSQLVDISAVLQTAPGTNSYVGQTAGRGSGFARCRYKTWFEEPTTVIHLVCVRPAPVYVNMQPPEWDFEVREDTYQPEFAHVGMVGQKKGTLHPTGTSADDQLFGYRNRYDELRVGFNDVAGTFKTTNVSYHQGRIFENAPDLNGDFLECNPSPRIFANMEGDQIEAAAIRNTFIEKNMVTPDGNPRY